MTTFRAHHSLSRILGAPGLHVVALVAISACDSTDGSTALELSASGASGTSAVSSSVAGLGSGLASAAASASVAALATSGSVAGNSTTAAATSGGPHATSEATGMASVSGAPVPSSSVASAASASAASSSTPVGTSDATDAGGVDPVVITDAVTRTASTFTFEHFPIEAGSDAVWNGPTTAGAQPTSTTYDTVVLENAYLRVTLLPDYGGRILSIVHKPTNRELLYQNPLGTPYLMQQGIFYYDYLVIMGGIFPSFPEPEHGKYWNLPYQLSVVSESAEAITIRMSRQDDVDLAAGVPEKYDVGRTDVLVELDVTLRAGSSNLEVNTKLTNTRSSAIPAFEFWMVNTLAPGSTPGQTAIPLNTRILAAMNQVHLLESSWAWFGDAEERVTSNDEIFRWDNLSYFENWVDQGTAFANPSYQANWWGMVNYDNNMGILRVSDNVQTPGLKLWTFGTQSLDIDINDSAVWLRPTIEMWYGVTPEFWKRGTMAANEARQWSDHYFPTMGLEEVTAASEHGAVYLSSTATGADKVLRAVTTLTLPEQPVKAILRLNGTVISEQDIVVSSTEANTVSVTVASSAAPQGAVFEAEFLQGATSLLSGQIALQ